MSSKALLYQGKQGERGAAMVEAAIAMPLFLAILLISINVMILCFKLLRFQYELADITRQTFLLDPQQRAGIANSPSSRIDWKDFLEDQLTKRLIAIGLTTKLTDNPTYRVEFTPANGKCDGWGCAWTAQPGDIFSITVTIEEPVFGARLANVAWQKLSVDTKAIAFVLMPENEDG